MDSILDPLLSFLLLYRYAALFILQFLSALGVPIPAATILMAAAAFAGEGYLNIAVVVVSGLAGNITGDVAAYLVTRRFGDAALRRLRLYRFIRHPRAQNIQGYFHRHEALTIIWSRCVGLATVVVNIFSGLGTISWSRFLVWDVVGQSLSVGTYITLGYFVGSDWQILSDVVGHISSSILVSIFVLVVLLWYFRKRQRRKNI